MSLRSPRIYPNSNGSPTIIKIGNKEILFDRKSLDPKVKKDLIGKRIIINDFDENTDGGINMEKLKEITGGDSIFVRDLYDRKERYLSQKLRYKARDKALKELDSKWDALENIFDELIGDDTDELLNYLSTKLTIHQAAALLSKTDARSGKSKSERFGLYPIKDWNAFSRTKQLEAGAWVADKVEFGEDIDDFNELTKDEQRVLIMAFGFFAVGDGSVLSMLAFRMLVTADTLEKKFFYIAQMDNERVHAETYGKMIFTLISDYKQREKILNAVNSVKSIEAMNGYIEKAMNYPKGDKHMYVMLVLVEVLMFMPQFTIIFWFRAYKKGKLKRVIFSNEEIAEDECKHAINGICNYNELPKNKKYTDKEIHKLVKEVVNLTYDFIDETFENVNLEGLNAKKVKDYVNFVADDLLVRLGHEKMYKTSNPLKWMNITALISKHNFYVTDSGQYSRFNVSKSIENAKKLCNGEVTKEERKINVKEVFSMKF